MTSEISRKWYLVLPVMALAMFVLVGGGCSSADSTSDTADTSDSAEATEVFERTGEASDFSGLEGSLTEQGMDTMAEAYTAFITDNNLPPSEEGFDQYRLSSQADSLPINDAYSNSLELEVVDGGYLLWSEGEDKQPYTADDYYKTYGL